MKSRIERILVLMFLIDYAILCAGGEYLEQSTLPLGGGICRTCPRGYACTSDKMAKCAPGQYSDYGATACSACPKGYKCPTPDSIPVPCAAGEYSEDGSILCFSCPPGFECKTPDKKDPCGANDYCAGGASLKKSCPSGYICPAGKELVLCPDGTYNNVAGGTSCLPCPAGSFCPDKTNLPKACPKGFYSLGGSMTCTLCPAGSYCSSGAPPVKCPVGEYSVDRSTTGCTACPAGLSCTGDPTPCAAGQYSLNGICVTCLAGYDCASGSLVKCPTGFYYNGVTSSCTQCPAGSACPDFVGAPVACPAGSYSRPGASSCTPCPIGNKCPSTSAEPTPCPMLTYQNLPGQTTCTSCGAASDCNVVGKSTPPTPCTLGKYFDSISCQDCPAGHYCPDPTTASVKQCAPGYYSGLGQSACILCPAGYYCADAATKTACPDGYYSTEGQMKCTKCPLGYECRTTLKTLAGVIKCPPGYTGTTGKSCDICPPGYMCPYPEFSPIPCSPGTYAPTAGMPLCAPCPQGSSCPATVGTDAAITATACSAGTYAYLYDAICRTCPNNHACTGMQKIDCPLNYYPGSGATVCIPCTTGSTCLMVGPTPCLDGEYAVPNTYVCWKCPVGYSCAAGIQTPCAANTYSPVEGAVTCTACPFGTYSPSGSDKCIQCPAGHRCSGTTGAVPCLPGQYSVLGDNSCHTGIAGFIYPPYSELSDDAIYLAPKGMYSFVVGPQVGALKCKAGKYSNVLGATDIADCYTCPAGFYCPEGTGNPMPYLCPQGYYCPLGSELPTDCPVNTYSTTRGGQSIDACRPCPLGFDCLGGSAMPQPCPTGYYCPGSTKETCPAGYYSGSRTGLKTMEECLLCPAGFYCPKGSEQAIPVPPGAYNPWMGISSPDSLLDCPPSHTCGQSGYSVFEKTPCKLGCYCPAGTSTPDQFPCPAGTYSNSYEAIAVSDCILCPRGFACKPGCTIAGFIRCAPGYYCPRGTPAVPSTSTPPAYSATYYPCPAGTYRATPEARRLEDCIPCTNGRYCVSGTSSPVLCPVGHYCPLGTKISNEFPCKPGTYTNVKGLNSQEGCSKCGLGNYCVGGGTIPVPCEPGYYNNFSEEAPECFKCPAGSYCNDATLGAGTVNPTPCDPGYYSKIGAQVCTACEDGYFCPELGISEAVMLSSFRCYAGMFCVAPKNKAIYPALGTHGCSPGKYCPEATLTEIPCPAGTYNPYSGRGSIDECFVVPAGYYTGTPGLTSYTACSPGYFCLEGSSSPTQHPCPAGTFRKEPTGATPEDCAVCWTGHKCPEGTAIPEACLAGYYCPLGTSIPEACPEGTYSSATNLYDSQACTPCDAGKYCHIRGLTAPSGICDAGFYCISGSKRPEPTDKITGNLCPKTGYCLMGAVTPTPCPAGKYMVIEGAYKEDQCVPCLPGYYCNGLLAPQPTNLCDPGYYCGPGEQIRNPTLVLKGFYAPLGSRHPYKCPFGTFSADDGKAQCDGCDAGSLCTGLGRIAKDRCPKGYYCPAYSWFASRSLTYDKISCPVGSYNDQMDRSSSNDCVPCSAGRYCPTRARETPLGGCDAGFYCLRSAPYPNPPKGSSPGNDYGICTPGNYCPQGTSTPVNCPQGTYSSSEMLTKVEECLPCYEGKYCDTAGIIQPTGDCDMGYYCKTKEITAAPAGQIAYDPLYCPMGSGAPINCPTGFYQTKIAQGTCTKCSNGQYCYSGTEHPCEPGYYCP